MSGKRYNWVPLHRRWNIRVHCDPSARKYCDKTTPYNIPNCTAMREVGTTVSRQRVVDGRDGAGVDICALNQVVDENEEQHSERQVRKGTCYCDTFYQNERRKVCVVLSTRVADKEADLLPSATHK